MFKLRIDITNFYLKIRYWLFRKSLNKKTWNDRNLIFYDEFNSLNNFKVIDKEFYNNCPIWLSRDAVHITNSGISILCYKDERTHISQQETRDAKYTSGMIISNDSFLIKNGVCIVKAKTCESWCAIRLLNKNSVDDVISIVEVLNKKNVASQSVGNTHFYLFTGDNKFHEYAIEIIDHKLIFYIDGIKTAMYKSYKGECPKHILINNASNEYTNKNTEFIIKSIKIYE